MTAKTLVSDATRLSDEGWSIPFAIAVLGSGVRKRIMTSPAFTRARCRSYGTFKNCARVAF